MSILLNEYLIHGVNESDSPVSHTIFARNLIEGKRLFHDLTDNEYLITKVELIEEIKIPY